MSHVMVKLFAPWVSWRVLPYSDKIALLFVLHTVAFLIITRITVFWRCFFSSYLLLRFVFRSYSMRIVLENEIGFEITGIKTLFHVPSPRPLIIS